MRQRFVLLNVLGLMMTSMCMFDCGGAKLPSEKQVEVSGDGGVVASDQGMPDVGITPDPGVTPDPGMVPEPGSMPDPGSTPDPGVTPDPGGTPETGVIPEPSTIPDPGTTPELAVDKGAPVPDVDPGLAKITCASPPPPGAKLAPAPKAYTGGKCPTLKPGMNAIKSKGNSRKFILVVPANLKPGEKPPVLFMWHWLKSSANKFLTQAEVQKAVDQQRFIALIPEAKGDLSMIVVDVPWPFLKSFPQARFEEEFSFFDDMLSCVSAQFAINKECVSTVGVSAGALFTAQLAAARSEYLSSFLSLSGGIDESAGVVAKVRPWTTAKRKIPALVLWGGAQDSCVLLNFEKASRKLQAALKKDGHFQIECVHNCKHGEPPIAPRPGKSKYESLWDFFLRHPYWLQEGTSPFQAIPWPHANVPWCGVGPNSSTIRSGSCGEPACPI